MVSYEIDAAGTLFLQMTTQIAQTNTQFGEGSSTVDEIEKQRDRESLVTGNDTTNASVGR